MSLLFVIATVISLFAHGVFLTSCQEWDGVWRVLYALC